MNLTKMRKQSLRSVQQIEYFVGDFDNPAECDAFEVWRDRTIRRMRAKYGEKLKDITITRIDPMFAGDADRFFIRAKLW